MAVSDGQAVQSGAYRCVGLGQNRARCTRRVRRIKSGADGCADSCPVCCIPLIRSGISATVRFAAAHYHCSKAGYRAGSDRGSPNQGRTAFSKRVMAQIRSPVRVST